MGTGYGDDQTCVYDTIPCDGCGCCEAEAVNAEFEEEEA